MVESPTKKNILRSLYEKGHKFVLQNWPYKWPTNTANNLSLSLSLYEERLQMFLVSSRASRFQNYIE